VLVYAVDLGTTNIKVALYNARLERLAAATQPVAYTGVPPIVEFDPDLLLDQIVTLIGSCARASGADTARDSALIVLTGQAESLVVAGRHGRPLRPAISWLDSRSVTEAQEMTGHFGAENAFAITGQPAAVPTWPATKLRWLSRHEPDVLERAAQVLMIKDFIQLRLTGEAAGELSTRAFSYLFDVRAADYWPAMLDFVGVSRAQLPPLVDPGTTIGAVLPAMVPRLPPAASWAVNAGTLDHFASMVGTGSYRHGTVSESAGTVLSLSVLLEDWKFDPELLVSYHRGVRGDDYVLFDGCDSGGGLCLEWFKSAVCPEVDFPELAARVARRGAGRPAPLFLPQLTGANPPEFLPNARGAFIDITLGHDGSDLAYAVMEGTAHLLRSNLEYCQRSVGRVGALVSTGGGSASAFWTQLKADVCDVLVNVPNETEATCRGAAALGLVSGGLLGDIGEAAEIAPSPARSFQPAHTAAHDDRYRRYAEALQRLYAS
jgi:sugar (pentulose or hexulose) kinase